MDKYSCFKFDLIEDSELVGMFDFPLLHKTNYDPENIYQFKMSEMKPRDKWGHFFIDDYRFNALWTNINRYIEQLKLYKGIITPDYSMYINMPKAQQIWNCYRNRAVAYYMQKQGVRIIPSVSWSDTSSYEWCFNGIEEGSTVAISTNGCHRGGDLKIFQEGLTAMEEKINPDKIIVVGGKLDIVANAPLIYFDNRR